MKPEIYPKYNSNVIEHDELWREITDPKPHELIMELKNKPMSHEEQLKKMLHRELSKLADDRSKHNALDYVDFTLEPDVLISGYEDMLAEPQPEAPPVVEPKPEGNDKPIAPAEPVVPPEKETPA